MPLLDDTGHIGQRGVGSLVRRCLQAKAQAARHVGPPDASLPP